MRVAQTSSRLTLSSRLRKPPRAAAAAASASFLFLFSAFLDSFFEEAAPDEPSCVSLPPSVEPSPFIVFEPPLPPLRSVPSPWLRLPIFCSACSVDSSSRP